MSDGKIAAELARHAVEACDENEERAVAVLELATRFLKEKVRVDAERKVIATKKAAANQPFEGGAEWLMHFPRNGV